MSDLSLDIDFNASDYEGDKFEATLDLRDMLRQILRVRAGQLPTKDAVIAWVQAAYDKYVAPMDIPYVPQAVENALVDPTAKLLLTLAITMFYDKLVREG